MDIPYRALAKEEFPSQLLEIPQPPKTLFLAGELPGDETLLLTVVGARKHSPYGREVCEALLTGLAGNDIAIISGLALGIDAIAHETALKVGIPTIAVPGSGLDDDVLYPRAHVGLARRILAGGGALLSEFAPNTKAAPWTFPERNRIMAGLAQATLVIEAEERSGTLITARMALDYNRDVFAVPGSIFSPLSQGPNRLIAQGAAAIRSSEDILIALGFSIDTSTNQTPLDFSGLSPDERRVMETLDRPMRRDLLIETVGLTVSSGNILLMKMEIAGLITEGSDGLRRAS